MVRAGVVRHPCEWMYCGYHEIQNPKQRYSLVNRQKLSELLGIKDNDQLSEYHRNWVEAVLKNGSNQREAKWTESIAVGDKEFVKYFLFLNSYNSKLNVLMLTGRPLGDEESFVGQVHDQRYIGLALFMGRRIDAGMGADGIGFVKMIF